MRFALKVRVKINKVGSRLSEPLTERHLSQMRLDEHQNSRVRTQQETCVRRTRGLAAPLASQHSTVCATIPNEAVHCRGKWSPVHGDLCWKFNNHGRGRGGVKQSICSVLSTQRRKDEKKRSNIISALVRKIKSDVLIDVWDQVFKGYLRIFDYISP